MQQQRKSTVHRRNMVEQLWEFVQEKRLITPREVERIGIPREYLLRLHRQGKLLRIDRGIYTLPDAAATEYRSLAEVAKRLPKAVVCLLSALTFHGVTTQNPFQVWVAIDRKARRPRITSPSVRIIRFSGRALTAGIEQHSIEGVPVRLYSAAKTVADCFKYRNKIGLDVAIEALKDTVKQRKATIHDIYKYAQICRVSNVIRPYIESL